MGILVSERFVRQTREISRAFEDQQLIANEMIRMMRRTLKKIQTIYVKDLLYGLMVRNMGTPEVINHTNRMLNNTTTHTRPSYNNTTVRNTRNGPERRDENATAVSA